MRPLPADYRKVSENDLKAMVPAMVFLGVTVTPFAKFVLIIKLVL
jgi:hypothetical protein